MHDRGVEIEAGGDEFRCPSDARISGGRYCWKRTPRMKIPSTNLHTTGEREVLVVVRAISWRLTNIFLSLFSD
jgi:hypothetical protein